MPKTIFYNQFFAACFLILSSSNALNAQSKQYQQKADGILVFLPKNVPGAATAVKLSVVSDKIIHVITSSTLAVTDKSLVAIHQTSVKPVKWHIIPGAGYVSLQTQWIHARVELATGAVSFTDKNKKLILKEAARNKILPAAIDGETGCQPSQVFISENGEAFYGLGQHQQGIMNYKHENLDLAQHNTEVAIPFLVSSKNYGILWDNYSITKFGDGRDYQPLSALTLYDTNSQPGGLTATYRDKKNAALVYVQQTESVIDYDYLSDLKKIPAAFPLAKGLVTWEGFIESPFTGKHNLAIKYSGYVKIWMDGKLVLDRWRQCWNPAMATLNINMQQHVKQAIKIEWNPDGGESFLTFKWLQPLKEQRKNIFSFSSEAGDNINYYFVYGENLDEVVSGYRFITGKASIIPKWAMGLWQSRERYKTQEEIMAVAKTFRKKNIPLDNIVMDWQYWKPDEWGSQDFDTARFPNPQVMIDELHKNNFHFMVSVWPKFYTGIKNYQVFKDKGWLYTKNIADKQKDWIGYVSTFYDAFNPQARKGFWELLDKHLFSKNVDAWWLDASEPDIHSNVSPAENKLLMMPNALGSSVKYFNAFPLQNAMGIYEGQRATDKNKRVFILTRSGFAGLQRYSAAVWSGDIAARWSDFKNQISGGINFSLSGIPYWTTDIGGFAVESRFLNPQGADAKEWQEQTARWYQFGAFCPLFRVHGQYPFREIYNVAKETDSAYQSMLYYDKLRYRLMPYIYSLAGETYHGDYTIMRGLPMDFAADKKVADIGDQYMFGPALLVNPVYEFKQRQRKLYLPAGTGWYNFYSNQYLPGAQYIVADAPLDKMPLFVKEGSIIPVGPDLQYTSQKQADTITLQVYTGKDGRFTLYEDEGINYNYEQGKFARIPFIYCEKTRSVTIGQRLGQFDGMLQQRFFKVLWITQKDQAVNKGTSALISYFGKPIQINMNK